MPGRDTRTRWQGIFARHQFGCAVGLPSKPSLAEVASVCNCKPGYYSKVYDSSEQRYLATRRQPTIPAAKKARAGLLERLETVEVIDARAQRLSEARTAFIDAARDVWFQHTSPLFCDVSGHPGHMCRDILDSLGCGEGLIGAAGVER
jgi:hypothetical protein